MDARTGPGRSAARRASKVWGSRAARAASCAACEQSWSRGPRRCSRPRGVEVRCAHRAQARGAEGRRGLRGLGGGRKGLQARAAAAPPPPVETCRPGFRALPGWPLYPGVRVDR
ncbi:hypothetical protein NN561_002146 [Cricetulus griseus]